jgi:hypothetical protein
MPKCVMCIAGNVDQTERIIVGLKDAGFSRDDVSVLFSDKIGTKDFAYQKKTKVFEGATKGAGIGWLLGGYLGFMIGMGDLSISGMGPFIAAGPIIAALSGSALGTMLGGIMGSSIGLSLPEYEVRRFEGKIKSGNILISVHAYDVKAVQAANEVLKKAGAGDIASIQEAKVC